MTSEELIARKAPGGAVVVFRLFLACYFIFVGVCGVLEWQKNKAVVTEKYDALAAPGTQIGWFRSYLNATVDKIKDKAVFGWLLLAAPLLLGLSLLLGLWTRLSTLLGVLYVLNLYLIKFVPALDALKKGAAYDFQPLVHVLELAALALLFFAGAGRTFGIDSAFWRKRIRTKLEPPAPEPTKTVTKASPSEQFIPLAKTGPARIEDTEGDFPAIGTLKKPAPPSPGITPPPGGGTTTPDKPAAPKGPGQ